MNPSKPAAAADDPRPLLADLSWRGVALALGLAVAAALLIRPIFATSLSVLVLRSAVLALWMLGVYVLAGQWPARWLPRWMPRGAMQLLAVALTAPLATAAIYIVSGGGLDAFLGVPARLYGFAIITALALLLGLIVTPLALLRERDAQSRAQSLRFELERERLEKQASMARLAQLQAQIEPHFLFNTLANVQALVEQGSGRAAPVLASLIAYLRAAMPRLHGGQPTLGDEVTLVRSYLALMQMRMPDRLDARVEVATELQGRPFPPMALLTLVENAVKHGLDPSEQGGRIVVEGKAGAGGGMVLSVCDDGVGMSAQARPGVGLSNLRERLRVGFGPLARLDLEEPAGGGLCARLSLPGPAGERP